MKGIFFAVMAGAFFAGTQLFDKIALQKYGIPPLWGVFVRSCVGIILISLVSYYKIDWENITPEMKESVLPLIASGFCFLIAIFSMFKSFTILPAGEAVAIRYASGIIVLMGLSVMFLSEDLTIVKFLGVAFCTLGIILVVK